MLLMLFKTMTFVDTSLQLVNLKWPSHIPVKLTGIWLIRVSDLEPVEKEVFCSLRFHDNLTLFLFSSI